MVEIAKRTEGTMDKLEKGGLVWSTAQEEKPNLASWKTTGLYYYKISMSLATLFLLLWQYGLPACARPPSITPQLAEIPLYVLRYAPLVWLDTGEQYFPSDIYAQVQNTHPDINFTQIQDPPSPLTLENLDVLNNYGNKGYNVFLTSTIDVTTSPKWLDGIVPDSSGRTNGATSCAIIVNNHGSGHVDAFYMYFYAFNLGNTVLFQELGDHIGDWEHNMIRFVNGTPTEVWFSQHGNGEAFTYKAVEKKGVRPFAYSALGSHANYAIAGTHDHTIPDLNLPAGFLQDYTSQGMLWDPTLNAYFYSYDAKTSSFTAADEKSPVGFMNYRGKWGDQQYPDKDERQKIFFGFRKFVSGPTGPWSKQLNRTKVCPENGIPCIVRDALGP